MPQVIEKFPNVKLVIAGDGPDVNVLKEQVERLTLEDYVLFTGPVEHEDVGNYYRMADLFVSASDTETQGLTYIEAMASGTPSIVYDTEYTKNIFNNKILGQTFTTQAEMLAEILDYLSMEKKKIPKDILEAKLEKISANHFGKEVYNFYQEVIENYKKNEEDLDD